MQRLKLVQVSREYINGKRQMVEFYEDKKGNITLKIAKEKVAKRSR